MKNIIILSFVIIWELLLAFIIFRAAFWVLKARRKWSDRVHNFLLDKMSKAQTSQELDLWLKTFEHYRGALSFDKTFFKFWSFNIEDFINDRQAYDEVMAYVTEENTVIDEVNNILNTPK